MSRASFKQGDLTRAIKGAESVGLPVARIEFNDNGFVLVVGDLNAKGPRIKRNEADALYGPQA